MLLIVSILVFIILLIGIGLTIYEFQCYILKRKKYSYPKYLRQAERKKTKKK